MNNAARFEAPRMMDTKGKKAEKKEASGHKTDAMLDVYDHEVPLVEPTQAGEADGVL